MGCLKSCGTDCQRLLKSHGTDCEMFKSHGTDCGMFKNPQDGSWDV